MANITPAATAAAAEAAEGVVQKAVSKLPKKEIKALGSSLLKRFGFTEAKNPEIAAGAIDQIIADNPGIENALKAYKGNTKMQEKVLLDAGIGKDQIAKYLPQAPRATLQDNITWEPPSSATVIERKGPPALTGNRLPVEATTPGPLTVQQRVAQAAPLRATAEPPKQLPAPLKQLPEAPAVGTPAAEAASTKVLGPLQQLGPFKKPNTGYNLSAKEKAGAAAATGAGLAAAGGAYLAAKEGQPEDTESRSDPFAPVVSETGAITMSAQERALFDTRAEAAGTSPIKRRQINEERAQRESEYQDLTDQADAQVRAKFAKEQGRGRLDFEKFAAYRNTPAYAEDMKAASSSILASRQAAVPPEAAAVSTAEPEKLAEKPAPEPAPAPTPPGGAETKSAAKPAGTPPPAPKGGAPAGTTQPSAVNKTTLKEPTKEVKKSQQAFPDTISRIINDRKRIADALGGGKQVNRKHVEEALKNLANVDNEIKTLYANKPPPQLADITKARRDALQAYKEKANLNEWLSIADRAIDAIASFASAQAAKGTPYVGTYKPSSTDYESRTAQALREYQAEAGMLQEERQESEKALAAYEKEKETAAEQMRRGREMAYRIAQEDVKVQEQEQDRVDKTVQDIFSANLSLQKSQLDVETAIQKFRATQAKEDAEAQRKAGKSVLELQIKEQQNAAEVAQKLLDASNELAMNPSDEKAILKYMSLQGKTNEQIQKEIKDDPTWNDAGSVKSIASKTATEAQTILNTSQSRTKELTTQLQSLLAGGTLQPTTPSPGQQPPPSAGQFKESEVDAAIKEGKYPGLTKQQVLDKLKQRNYSIVMGQ